MRRAFPAGWRGGITGLVMILALWLGPDGATSDEGSAELDDDRLSAEAGFTGEENIEPSDPAEVPRGDGTPGGLVEPFTVKRIVDYYLDQPCGSEPDHVNTAVRYVEVDPTDDDAERMLLDTFECLPIPRSGDPDEFEVPPPRAVDIQDAVSRVLPLPELAVDPDPEGLTGLETYLWYRGDGASELEEVETSDGSQRPGLTVTAAAGPYEVTATAWIVQYRWETGDGVAYTSSAPGSPDDPAATHIYETKGDYTVVTETVWVGTYTWAVGSLSGSGELDAVTQRTDHPYTVVEARAVLTR
jgi:hypothetical protein